MHTTHEISQFLISRVQTNLPGWLLFTPKLIIMLIISSCVLHVYIGTVWHVISKGRVYFTKTTLVFFHIRCQNWALVISQRWLHVGHHCCQRMLALFSLVPRPSPSPSVPLNCTASDGKLGEGLGMRLWIVRTHFLLLSTSHVLTQPLQCLTQVSMTERGSAESSDYLSVVIITLAS